jgi:signal transduction histidine kinase
MDRVPVAMLCSERIRAFTGVIHIAETPRSGARTVRGPVGTLIDRALGDLLKNAVVHGAATVWVRMAPLDDMLLLEVADDGPGFDEAAMDNPGTSLHRLREKARELGGDLVKAARSPHGSRLTLTVPGPAARPARSPGTARGPWAT